MHYLKGVRQPIPTGHVTITDAASLAAAIPRTGLCNGTGCVLDAKGKCSLKANSPGYCTATLVAPLRRKENTESNEWLGLDIDSPDLHRLNAVLLVVHEVHPLEGRGTRDV